ncbi:MAG: VCBS repeat-containing protein [Myxococcota bacterium]
MKDRKSMVHRGIETLNGPFVSSCLASLVVMFLPGDAAHAACSAPGFTAMPPISLPVAGTPRAIAPADFNGDGLDDLVVAVDGGAGSAIVQLRAVGDGTFASNIGPGAPVMTTPVGSSPRAVAVGLLNRDGWPDLAVATDTGVGVWIGSGPSGSYSPGGGRLFGALAALDVAIADWNRDEHPDIFATFADGFQRVFQNLNDQGSFSDTIRLDEGTIGAEGGHVGRIAVGDLRGGGEIHTVGASLLDGTLQFTRRLSPRSTTHVATYPAPWQPVVVDFDLDGNLDLATTYPNDHLVRLWRGGYSPRSLEFPAPNLLTELPAVDLAALSGEPGAFPYDLDLADVTADHRLDLIVTDVAGDAVWALVGDGGGGFLTPLRLSAGPTPVAVAIGRFDLGAATDIAVIDETDARLRIYRNTCPTPETNLTVAAMEVTQTVQDLPNTTMLVAGRRTFVRAYPLASAGSHLVTATLQAADGNGVPLPGTLRPSSPGLVSLATGVLLRRNLSVDGLYFELPPEWTVAGDLELTLTLNPDRRVSESSYADNVRKEVVRFQAMPPIKIEMVRFGFKKSDGTEILPPEDWAVESVSQLQRMLPADRLVVTSSTFHSDSHFFFADETDSYYNDVGDIIAVLHDYMRATMGVRRSGVVYMLATGRRKTGGVADNLDGWVAVTHPKAPLVTVHEFGHLMGQQHVECTFYSGDEVGSNPSYPYPGGTIGGPDLANPSFVGFDGGDASLNPPAPTVALWPDLGVSSIPIEPLGDIMSYCDPKWMSDYTYERIAQRFLQIFPMADPLGDFLAVRGVLGTDGRMRRLDAQRIDQASYIPTLEEGDHAIRLEDASNALLAEYRFTARAGQETDEYLSFEQIVAFVPGTRWIAITARGEKIATIAVSENAPAVEATLEPDLRELGERPMTVRITAADADGDPIATDILWSADRGATWRVVSANVRERSVALDPGDLASTHGEPTGILRVRVSDGVLTGYTDMAGFSTLGTSPTVRINHPFPRAIFTQNQTLVLAATPDDADDGTPPSDAVAWYSDLDGYLGKGIHLAPVLSEGSHNLTVQVTDSDGRVGSATTPVQIVRAMPRLAPPKAIIVAARTALLGDRVGLDASESSGEGDEPLRLFWQMVSSPGRGMLRPVIDPIDPTHASFEATDPGRYGIRLYASNSMGTSTADVFVDVEAVPEPSGGLAFGVAGLLGLAGLRRRSRIALERLTELA